MGIKNKLGTRTWYISAQVLGWANSYFMDLIIQSTNKCSGKVHKLRNSIFGKFSKQGTLILDLPGHSKISYHNIIYSPNIITVLCEYLKRIIIY